MGYRTANHLVAAASLFALSAFSFSLTGCGETETMEMKSTKQTKQEDKKDGGDTEMVEAKAGVGEKGKGKADTSVGEMMLVPVNTYFSAQERIAFAAFTNELKTRTALNDGKGPQSLDELMEKVIKPARIQLPKLPEGHSYAWNAEEQKLMVKKPK